MKIKLEAESVQRSILAQVLVENEKASQARIQELERQLAAAKQATPIMAKPPFPAIQAGPLPIEGTAVEMEHLETFEAGQGQASTSKAQETPGEELSRLEVELRQKIDTELDPLVQECMLWELRILHSANIAYLKHGDATRDYHQPALPLPLLKQEVIHSKKQFLPDIPQEELGGYEPITM